MKRLTFVGLFSLLLLLGGLTLTTVLAAPGNAPRHITSTPACSPIITNTTWTVISSPYVVCGNGALSVAKGITLTVEPGVEVQFQSNARLNVNGTLSAIGTSEQPITFTGVVTTPGSWQGIGIYGTLSETNRSVLDHVLIEYGGINIGSSAQLYLEHAAITLTHSLIRNGQLHGIYGAAGGLADLDDVAFENNAGYAVLFADGTVNPVLLHLTGAHVWENSGLPYVMVGSAQVAIGATLLIEPGVEVQFKQGQSLQIAGKLTALGLPDRPITFTGSTKSIGWWSGLEVDGDTYHPASAQFDHVLIEYGGLGPNSGDLMVTDGQASVAHSIIRYGNTNGVYVNVRGTGTVIESSQIISHTDYGVKNIVTGPAYAVNAANNWWGDPSGPQSDNSSGLSLRSAAW